MDGVGQVVGKPSVFPVESKEAAKRQAKTPARPLRLKVYGIVDKPRPWLGARSRKDCLSLSPFLTNRGLHGTAFRLGSCLAIPIYPG
jgi:hypothetical protein